MKTDLVVGQKLWYVPYNYRGANSDGYEVTILKVGRKWARITGYKRRIDLETLQVDGVAYSSPGKCYISADHYKEEVELNKEWQYFANLVDIHRNPPKEITIYTIKQAISLLNLETYRAA